MEQLNSELEKHANPEKAKLLQRFFKTGKGEYGEGDIFLGITVPQQRILAKEASERLSLENIKELLKSEIHEKRLIALFILIEKYKKATEQEKENIVDTYLNSDGINNWDLVDSSAHKILGDFLIDKDREVLYKLTNSENLWKRRIAIIACFAFLPQEDFKDALEISEILLSDREDLIHKAVGWVLREIGKRNLGKEENFLKKHYKKMPRTMLRYAIEKFPEQKRKAYLNGEIN